MTGCRHTTPTQPSGSGAPAAELSAWTAAKEHTPRADDMDRPNAARMYEYYLGTGHNFAADRHAARAAIAAAPRIVATAWANRGFARRAVQYAVDQGVGQFLDLGAGLPLHGGTYETVRAMLPGAPVVHVDNDPVMVTMAQTVVEGDPACAVIHADIRDMASILDAPHTRGSIDFAQPVCVLLTAVLHYVPGDLTDIMTTLRGRLCAGSLLVISHATVPSAECAAQADAVREIYTQTTTPLTLRSSQQIAALFTGFDLVAPHEPDPGTMPPALVPVDQWRPRRVSGNSDAVPVAALVGLLAGVARKPPHRTSTSRPPKPTNRMPTDMTTPTRQGTVRRTLAVPAAALSAAALTALAAAALPATHHAAATSAALTHPSPSPTAPTPPASTADLLRALAATVRSTAADQQPGPYTYHHLRRWILDTTGTPAQRPNTPAVFRIDIQRWEAADGSGLGIHAELPPAYDLAAAAPAYRTTDAEFTNAHITRTRYRAGNLSSPITGPLAVDAAALARQLTYDPVPDGPQATLRAVDELYTNRYVTRATRAAVLDVLAPIAGLRYQPDATDRLGRHGFAVSLDAHTDTGPLRFSLIFDPATGQLLASSQQLIGPATYLAVSPGLCTYYTLFLDQGHRPDLA